MNGIKEGFYSDENRKEKLFVEACKRGPHGDWLYGRRKLMKKFPEFTEWQVRQILKNVRGEGVAASSPSTPETVDLKRREREVLSLPRIIVNTRARPKLRAHDRRSSIESWLIASDFHAPRQHEASCEIFYQLIEYIDPIKVFLLGDLMTLDNFSRFDKDPTAPTWFEDVAQAGKVLANVMQAASDDTELLWFAGNHEQRFQKHLLRHDTWLYEALNIPKLFTIAEPGKHTAVLDRFTYITEAEKFYEDLNLVIKHGNKARKHSTVSGRAELEALWLSVIVGHCHRLGIMRRSSGRSRYKKEQTAFAVETGCMCDYDQHYTEGHTNDWQHGFIVLTIDRSDESPVVEPTIVEINHGKALFRDRVFRG